MLQPIAFRNTSSAYSKTLHIVDVLLDGRIQMSTQTCLIGGCTSLNYAPAGTGALCKEHFLEFLTWRRKKGGLATFKKYGAMTMEERDPTVNEWAQTVTTKT